MFQCLYYIFDLPFCNIERQFLRLPLGIIYPANVGTEVQRNEV